MACLLIVNGIRGGGGFTWHSYPGLVLAEGKE